MLEPFPGANRCNKQAKLGGLVVVGKLEEVLHLLQMAAL